MKRIAIPLLALLLLLPACGRLAPTTPVPLAPVFLSLETGGEALKPLIWGSHGWGIDTHGDFLFAYFYRYVLRYDAKTNRIDKIIDLGEAPEYWYYGVTFSPDGQSCVAQAREFDGPGQTGKVLIDLENETYAPTQQEHFTFDTDRLFQTEDFAEIKALRSYECSTAVAIAMGENRIGAILPCDEAGWDALGYYKFAIIDLVQDKIIQECPMNVLAPGETISLYPPEFAQPPVTQVSWRVVPTDAAMKAVIAAWREEPGAAWELGELKLSEGKTVTLKRGWNADGSFIVSSTILLRDEADGSETVLMEHNNPSYSTSSSRSPIPTLALDERYFVIDWHYYEGSAGCSVFDTQEKRDIPVKFPEGALSAHFLGFADGWLYFGHRAYSYEPGDPLHVTRVELGALIAGNDLPAEDALAYRGVGEFFSGLISPGAKYYAGIDSGDRDAFLYVFDLARGECALRIALPEGYSFRAVHFMNDNLLYFYDANNDGNVLEVMLP